MQEAEEKAVSGVKTIISKLNWKHGVFLATSIGLFLYPQPILKLFIPLVSKLNKNRSLVECQTQVNEIVLTTNIDITL